MQIQPKAIADTGLPLRLVSTFLSCWIDPSLTTEDALKVVVLMDRARLRVFALQEPTGLAIYHAAHMTERATALCMQEAML